MPVDQVEQGEQVNPDNVYEVPVEPADFDGRVIFGCEAAFPRHIQEPGEKTEADNHVQRVQSGHDEVEREENFGVTRVSVLIGMSGDCNVIEAERRAGNVVLFEFVFIFFALNAQEHHAEEHGDDEAANQKRAARDLRGPYGEDYGQAAADQHSGVGGAERGVDGFAGGAEVAEIPATINQIGAEQSAEEHNFGAQKYPHPETGGVALLLRFGEVVQQFGVVLLFVMKADDGAIRQL